MQVFTDDPVNWVKWGIVFAVLILGYRISIPLYKKASYRFGYAYKRDIARARGHVIKATIQHKHCSGDVSRYDWYASYEYSIDGKTRTYRAFFKHPNSPPRILYLYYVNNPRRLFSMSGECPGGFLGNPLFNSMILLITFLPWILACITFAVLQIPLPQ